MSGKRAPVQEREREPARLRQEGRGTSAGARLQREGRSAAPGRRRPLADRGGKPYALDFQVGSDVPLALARAAKTAARQGAVGKTELRRLQRLARAEGPVGEAQQMFLAGLLDAGNVRMLSRMKVTPGAEFSFSLASIREGMPRVKRIGRRPPPARSRPPAPRPSARMAARHPFGPPGLAPTQASTTPADPATVAAAPDPVDDDTFVGWGFEPVGPELPSAADELGVRQVLKTIGAVSATVLDGSTATWVTPRTRVGYYSFRHPTFGVVARAYCQIGGWTAAKGDFQRVFMYARQTGTGFVGSAPTAAAERANAEAKLKALSPELTSLLGGSASMATKDPVRLLRIAEKLKGLSADERAMFAALATHLTNDLDRYEQSIDAFIAMRNSNRQALEQAAKDRKATGERTLEERLGATWQGFDPKAFGGMDRAQKEATARKVADAQVDVQLDYMKEHPGETAVGMAKGLVRVDELAKGVYGDVQDAASGDKSAHARWAGGVGATSKISGWLAGAAGVIYIGMLFVPGANVAVLAGTALALGVTAIALSSIEAELRIQAAADANTVDEFKTQTTKSAAATTNVYVGVALMVLALVVKLIARTPIPGRLQTVGGALKAAKGALLEKTGAGAALDSLRADLLSKLRGARKGMPELVAEQARMLAEQTAKIEKLSGAELLDRLAKGDAALAELTGVGPEQAAQIQALAATPKGAGVPEQVKTNIVRALKEAPPEAAKQVDQVAKTLDRSIADIEQAKDAAALKSAVETAEGQLSPEAQAEAANAAAKRTARNLQVSDRFKGKSDAEVKTAAQADPAAVDELVRRYEGRTIAELEKLSKAGDGTADYVMANRRRAGYRRPAEVPLRPSNLPVLDRLKARLTALRTASKIPKQGSKGGTFGVAETDLGTPTKTFEGGSPVTGSSPDPTYQPKSTFPSVQGHAEQNLVGSLRKAILAAGLDEAAMEGKSVWMLIEQEVCGPCKSGLGNPSAPSGVLKQFSLEHPKITVEVMNLETGEVLRFRNGALVRE